MLVTFSSRAGSDVMMFGEVAHKLMGIMGKMVADKGVITVEQLPDAIAKLRAAVASDVPAPAAEETEGEEALRPVSLTQRALPLIELMERAREAGKDVHWGF